MLFEQFETDGLAHYSYAVGCPAAGELAIVDPRRDVDVYLDYADRHDVAIRAVLETHIHADYASGARELARRTDAELSVSGHDRAEDYEVAFPHADLLDGDSIEIGAVRLAALHTPGHTPEHLSFLVYDRNRSADVPSLLLSGDFLFVGSLGRPDLLGEGAKRGLAEALHTSVSRRLSPLPDGVEVYPAHGAGSMCGSGMAGRSRSTLGNERIANPYLSDGLQRDEFVARILENVPPFPPYYRRMKRVNSEGPAILDGLPGRRPIAVDRFREQIDAGAVVVDVRGRVAFGAGHVPGSFGIGVGSGLSTWASWVVPYDTPILLVAGDDDVEAASRGLIRVGLDDVRGHLEGGMRAWIDAGEPLAELPQIDPRALHDRLRGDSDVAVLDVRTDEEWEEGHIEGAVHVMGGFLEDNLDAIPAGDRTVAVVCDSDYRSTVAASVLQRHGFRNVVNVAGGMGAWRRAGLPTFAG